MPGVGERPVGAAPEGLQRGAARAARSWAASQARRGARRRCRRPGLEPGQPVAVSMARIARDDPRGGGAGAGRGRAGNRSGTTARMSVSGTNCSTVAHEAARAAAAELMPASGAARAGVRTKSTADRSRLRGRSGRRGGDPPRARPSGVPTMPSSARRAAHRRRRAALDRRSARRDGQLPLRDPAVLGQRRLRGQRRRCSSASCSIRCARRPSRRAARGRRPSTARRSRLPRDDLATRSSPRASPTTRRAGPAGRGVAPRAAARARHPPRRLGGARPRLVAGGRYDAYYERASSPGTTPRAD